MCYTSKDISPKALNSLIMSRRTYQATSPVWSSSLFHQLPNLPILSTMTCSHSGWPSIHLGYIQKQVPHCITSVVCLAVQEGHQSWKPINCPVDYAQLTRLWWPSKCQRLFGPATEYARLDTVIAQRIQTFWGSTRARHLRTRSRCIINPSDLNWPKTIEEPTKQPCSLECTYFAVQLFISDVTKAWQVVETKLGYSAVNCPAWDKQHASDIFPTETQRTELNQCLFLYVIFWPSNLSINYSIWWRKGQNSYLWASCSTGKFTPSIAVPKHQLKIPGHFENCFTVGVWYKWR